MLPVLNPHPVFFPQAVQSLLAQTFTDFELIIVEDPSPSSALDLLGHDPDSRIRHFRNQRATGLVDQLNRGLAQARADLVARMDADDVCEPVRLQQQVDFLGRHPEVGVLGSQLRLMDDEGRLGGYRHYPLEHQAIVPLCRATTPWPIPR